MKNTKNKKILVMVLCLFILLGIVCTVKLGINVGIDFSEGTRIDMYIGKDFEIKDMKQITNEILGKETTIKKVEVYKDMVSITTKSEVTDEKLENLVQKVNEKYEVEFKAENVKVYNIANIHIKDMFKVYVSTILKASVIAILYIAVYSKIRNKKTDILKQILQNLAVLAITILIIVSFFAITRIAINKYIFAIMLTAFVGVVGKMIYLNEKTLEVNDLEIVKLKKDK